MTNDEMNKKIEKTRADMALMDAYWFLSNSIECEQEIPVDKVLLLVQFMLTSYLVIDPDQRDVQLQVQKLLIEILPRMTLSANTDF